MAKPILSLPVLVCLAALGATAALCGRASAQVTVDLHALDAAPGANPAPAAPDEAKPAHKPVPKRLPPHRTTATGKPTEKPTAKAAEPATKPEPKQAGPSAPTAPPPPPKPMAPAAEAPAPPAPEPPAAVVGTAPPDAPVIPPPVAADAPMAPEPPPLISADAGTVVDALPPKDGDGVRLDFKTGESGLTQRTADAVKAVVETAPKADTTTFNIMAYAAGVPEDPSTARRLSLSRALAVRGALMAAGAPSTHIYVRALGAEGGDGPADRVDVVVMGANAAAPPPGPQSATPPAHATP